MMKCTILILVLSFLLVGTAFAIKTNYNQIGYYNTFYQSYLAEQDEKEVIQSFDSSKQALISKAEPEKQNEEQLKSNEGESK